MKIWLQRRATVAVLITCAFLLLLAGVVGSYVASVHESASDALAEIEPRYARLAGLRDATDQLEQSVKDSRAALARLGYPAGQDAAQVGNDLQQRVRRSLEAAGLTVHSSQALPARDEKSFDRVSVMAQAEGPLSRLQIFLAALQSETPAVFVDSLNLQTAARHADDGSPVVVCRLTIAVLRLQS